MCAFRNLHCSNQNMPSPSTFKKKFTEHTVDVKKNLFLVPVLEKGLLIATLYLSKHTFVKENVNDMRAANRMLVRSTYVTGWPLNMVQL